MIFFPHSIYIFDDVFVREKQGTNLSFLKEANLLK